MFKFIGNMEAKSVGDISVITVDVLLGPAWPRPSLALWFARGRLSSWGGEAEKRRVGILPKWAPTMDYILRCAPVKITFKCKV